jgi:hypothetical protein
MPIITLDHWSHLNDFHLLEGSDMRVSRVLLLEVYLLNCFVTAEWLWVVRGSYESRLSA